MSNCEVLAGRGPTCNDVNNSSLAGQGSTYGGINLSGNSRSQLGDTIIHAGTIIQEFRLFGEITSDAALSAMLRSQLRIDTSQSSLQQHRGRDRIPRGGGSDSYRGSSHRSSTRTVSSARGESPTSSRSPSSTRIPRPSLASRGRRYSSLSRDSRLIEQYHAPSLTSSIKKNELSGMNTTPTSSIASSTATPLREQDNRLASDNDHTDPATLQECYQPDLNKPLPWTGHLLDPGGPAVLSRDGAPQIETRGVEQPTSNKACRHRKRHGVDLIMLEQFRHLQLAFQEFEERFEALARGDARHDNG